MDLFKKCFVLFVFFFILGICSFTYLYYQQQPVYNGVIEHRYPQYGNVTIHRDKFGIPHVAADNLEGAYYGVGFAHGQDRLYQLYSKRELVYGRFSKMLGAFALNVSSPFPLFCASSVLHLPPPRSSARHPPPIIPAR